ncbi:hypothetical protein D3C80_1813710 [compost metagenome]
MVLEIMDSWFLQSMDKSQVVVELINSVLKYGILIVVTQLFMITKLVLLIM